MYMFPSVFKGPEYYFLSKIEAKSYKADILPEKVVLAEAVEAEKREVQCKFTHEKPPNILNRTVLLRQTTISHTKQRNL